MEEDNIFMERIKNGDANAADTLIEKYQSMLFRFIYRLTLNNSDSEDIFQETWLRVVRYCSSFKQDQKFSTWLFQIATNCTRDFFKKNKNTISIENVNPISQKEELSSVEHQEFIQKIIHELPLAQREVLVLKFFHDKKEREISEILDIPLGTVKSRLHTTLHFLKSCYGENNE